jgi:hypothetical protein
MKCAPSGGELELVKVVRASKAALAQVDVRHDQPGDVGTLY